MALQIEPEIEYKFRTSDGEIFNSLYDAERHEKDLIVNLNVERFENQIPRYQAEVPEWITKLPYMNKSYSVNYRDFARVFTTAVEAALWEEAMEQTRLQLQPVQDMVNFPVAHHPGKRQSGLWNVRAEAPAVYLFLTEVHFAKLKKQTDGSLDV